jgi:hypothetical protein
MGSNPTVPTILENSADAVGAFLVMINFLSPEFEKRDIEIH